jgi:NAD dependent epimerase/dehydratase family enzyme
MFMVMGATGNVGEAWQTSFSPCGEQVTILTRHRDNARQADHAADAA